ncbi:MAG: hypothetical protein LCH38_14545 [Proteobacteria bacterium]|nr:hypothetical protein [Pseudomonadota bacterium]
MSDFPRDTLENAARWASLEKDVAAIYSDAIKTHSGGSIEFLKITLQSLIYINAGALTIVPALTKIVSDGVTKEYKYIILSLGAFVVGLLLALLCTYGNYAQRNHDYGEQVGLRERQIEFFKTTKDVADQIKFVSFSNEMYNKLNDFISDNSRKSNFYLRVAQISGSLSAFVFIAGSIFAAAHILKFEPLWFLGF